MPTGRHSKLRPYVLQFDIECIALRIQIPSEEVLKRFFSLHNNFLYVPYLNIIYIGEFSLHFANIPAMFSLTPSPSGNLLSKLSPKYQVKIKYNNKLKN